MSPQGYVCSVTSQQLNLLAVVSLEACWSILALTWLVGAIYSKSSTTVQRTHPWVGAIGPIGWIIVAVVSVAVPAPDWRPLAAHTLWLRLLGLAILLAATALALWARFTLGLMWSAWPTVKRQHQLRTTGPYGVTRHPIYTGKLGMMLGSLLLAGGRWIIPFPIFLVLFLIKIHVEEGVMLVEFPDDYPRYCQRTSQLIPGLCLLSQRRLLTDRPPDCPLRSASDRRVRKVGGSRSTP